MRSSILIFLCCAVCITTATAAQDGYLGVLFTRESVNLSAESVAIVKTVHVRLGDRVEAGQLLVLLESPSLDDEIARARAARDGALAEIDRFEAEFEQASRQLARRESAPDAFSEEEIKSLETKEAIAEANLRSTKATAKQRKASLDELVAKKAALEVRAPFAGSVAACSVNPGERVSTGAAIARLLSSSGLWVRFAIPEDEASTVRGGDAMRIVLEGDPSVSWTAHVQQISPEIDASIGVLIAEASLDVSDPTARRLPVGSVVRVFRSHP